MSQHEKDCLESEQALKPQLTEDFIKTLVTAARTYGWMGDYSEVVDFVNWCSDVAGQERQDLEPFHMP
jgi:hypothetical protein